MVLWGPEDLYLSVVYVYTTKASRAGQFSVKNIEERVTSLKTSAWEAILKLNSDRV